MRFRLALRARHIESIERDRTDPDQHYFMAARELTPPFTRRTVARRLHNLLRRDDVLHVRGTGVSRTSAHSRRRCHTHAITPAHQRQRYGP